MTIVSENGFNHVDDFNGLYVKVGENYSKMRAEHDGEKTTIVNFDEEFNSELSLEKISVYSLSYTLKKSDAIGHGIIAQDLLELPKFKDFVFDDSGRNTEKGLVEGDEGYSYHGIDYVEFVPVLLAGLQDANKLIKELRQEVDDLKQQLNDQNE